MSAEEEGLVGAWAAHGGELAAAAAADWEAALREAIDRARTGSPSVSLDEATFVAALVPCLEPGDPPSRLGELELAHLYLATACACGDGHAAAMFVKRFRGDVESALSRFGDDRAFRADVADEVFDKLLVGTPDRPPRIAAYRGRGDLGRWIRVTAVRTAVDRTRGRGRRESPASDRALVDGLDEGDDPEMRVLKEQHREHFRAAFEHAVASLTDRERRLLRERIVFGLGVVQIAELHETSKSTAARWVTEARQRVIDATHEYLQRTLDVDPEQLQSLMKLATTGMQISVARILDRDG